MRLELGMLALEGLQSIEMKELKAVEAALRKIKVEVTDKVTSMILAKTESSELELNIFPDGKMSIYDVWHPNDANWNEVQASPIRYYKDLYKQLVYFGLVEKVPTKRN